MVSENFLQNTGIIRDLCQDVCSCINNLIENKLVGSEDKTLLNDYYKMALECTTELANLGYFNKKIESKDIKRANTLIENVLKIEDYANKIVKKVWEKDITDIEKFDPNNFKLCVRALPLNLLTLSKDVIDAFNTKEEFVQATLISNRNITVTPPNYTNTQDDNFPFGIIYEVNNSNFVMASEVSSLCSVKRVNEDSDNTRSVQFSSCKVSISGNAVKLKTPLDLIANNLETPLQTNNNVVILNGKETRPIGIFCLSYNTQKVNLLKRRLSYIAKQLDVPIIEIDILNFYKNNKYYFSSNTLSRKIFNIYVDKICADLHLYCKFDFKLGAKKLVGLNTNLRYNFLFKFIENINSYIDGVELSEKETADLIVDKFLKAAEKHNTLTKKREKANGEPLFFPNDTVFIALPTDFLN